MTVDQLKGAMPGAGYAPIQSPDEIAWPGDKLKDETALKLVMQNLSKAETYIGTKAYRSGWDLAERLYLAQVPTPTWEGTNIPRSALGRPLVYEHVESILPQVMLGLYSDDKPFELKPRPKTHMDTARANAALINWELGQCNFVEELRKVVKSCLIYDIGVAKWGWNTWTETRRTYERKQQPLALDNPLGGQALLDSKESDETVPVDEEIEVNQPFFEFCNIRHLLVDPGCRCDDIRTAKFVIHRLYMSAEDLDSMRDVEGYTIPSREQLLALFMPAKEAAYGSPTESSLGVEREFKAVQRSMDTTVDPLKQGLEVLEYWDKGRVITILQRAYVLRNDANEFGKLPFLSIAFTDVIDSFYGLSVARLIGNEQRMQQGVLNAFLDGLSLDLMGMYIQKSGSGSAQQIRMRPGGVINTADPTGLKALERNQMAPEAMATMSTSDARAARVTGANEMAVQGAMPSDKSSITRTAAGVNALTGGSGSRLQYFIERMAGQVFVPFLEAVHMMNGKLRPSQIQRILDEELEQAYAGTFEGTTKQKDVLDLVNGRYEFQILATAKLQSRKAAVSVLPLLYQFLLTDPVVSSLQVEGKKVNVKELVSLLFDTTGFPDKGDVIVDMTADDLKRSQQNNPALIKAQAQQAQQSQAQQDKLETIDAENTARAGRKVLESVLLSKEREGLGI